MQLPFTVQDFILYFNIAIIAIMVLFALIGMLRGTYKSVYYMIATLIVFVGGWLLSYTICNWMLDFDLSSFNRSIPVGEGDDQVVFQLTTIRETLTDALKYYVFGENLPEDSLVLNTLFAFIVMILRIVYFLILVILSFTVFKIIFDLIWLIVKPRKKDKNGKRKKPSALSRLGGFGIGAVKGLMYTLLICFLFAGLASIVADLKDLQEQSAETTDTYTVVIINDTATLIKLSDDGDGENKGSGIGDVLGEYGEILDLVGAYRNTIAGQVFGSIKIQEAGLDEYVFDGLLTMKIKDGDTTHTIKIREELSHAAKALSKIPGILTGGFTMSTLTEMDKDVLAEAIDELTSLKMINVAIPVGVEIVLANEKFLEGIDNEYLRAAVKNSLGDLKGLDYSAEIKQIGYVFIDAVQLLQFSEDGKLDIDFLSLDPDTVESIFEKLGQLGLVDVVAPLAVEYLCSMESFQQSFENMGINIDEIIHPENYSDDAEPIQWSSEISNIGKVYKAFAGLGITTEEIESMNFEFTDENIAAVDGLVDAIFNSKVISKAVPVLVDLGKSKMPEEYSAIVTIPDAVDWDDELKPLLKGALVLFSSGLFGGEGEMMDRLAGLDDAKIDQLALYLSQSSVVKTNLKALIDKFLGPQENEDGTTSKGVFGDIELTSLESADDWTQLEIASIFKSVKLIIDSGIIGSDDIFKSFSDMSDETVSSLATHLSHSKFIRTNLSGILTYFLDQMSKDEEGLTLVSLSEEEWTETEMNAIFQALKTIAGSGMLNSEGTDGIKSLTDDTIDKLGTNISASKFLTRNLTKIMDMLLGSIDLGEGIEIHGFENAEDWTKTEIVCLLKSARLIVNYTDDITKIINVTEEELDTLMGSKLISQTLVSFIKSYTGEGKSLEVVKGVNLVGDEEWYDVDKNTNSSLSGNILTITPVSDTDKYYIYVDDAKVASTASLSFDFSTLAGVSPSSDNVKVVAKEFGEIRKMFISIQTLVGDSFNSETISDDIIKSITSLDEADILKIIDSKLIAETITCKIEEFADGENAFISIPEGELTAVNLDGSKDRSAWNEQDGGAHGELFKILRAITVIFAGKDLGSDTFEFSTDLITNINSSDIDKITESVVINETIIKKIEDMANEENPTIFVPTELQASPTKIDRDKWINNKETANLLNALKSVFGGGTVDTTNLKIKPIIDGKDEILKSLVICETLKKQVTKDSTGITIPTELPTDTLVNWKNTYDANGNVTKEGELSALLGAIADILSVDDNTNIDEISTDNLSLNNVITKQDNILKSLVITGTVKDKVTSFDGIVTPINEGLSTTNLDGWKNTYNDDGTLATKGEVARLLNAVKIVLNVDENTKLDESLSTDSIKLNNVIDQQDAILQSLVITATIKEKITSSTTSGIVVPENEGLSTTDLVGWKNTYTSAGVVVTRGEISALLNSVDIILDINDSTTVDNFSTDDIKLNNVITNKDTILKSLVITATIKDKITSSTTSGIVIPENEGLSNTDLSGWKNTYNEAGNVNTRGEISALLTSVDIILDINESTTLDNFNTDDIKLNNVITNQDNILKSIIITATIKDKITSSTTSGIVIPENEGLSNTTLEGWKNTYTEAGVVESRGEISKLLTSVDIILEINESTTLDNFNTDDIKLNNVITNQDNILKSIIITATIKDKITSSTTSGIVIPENEGLSNTTLEGWKNTYTEAGVVESRGEISKLLTSVDIILEINESTTLDNFNTDDIKLNNVIAEQDDILKSIIITATIKDKITSSTTSGIVIPEDDSLSTTDLSGWKNTYTSGGAVVTRGEIAALLTSVDIILNVDDSTTLDNIETNNIKLNNVIANQDNILKSLVITATIKDKITSIGTISVPTDEALSTTNLDGWKNTYTNAGVVETRGEISRLLNAVNIILAFDDSTTVDNFNADDIKLGKVVYQKDTILKSLVISETVRKQISDNATLKKPAELSTTDLTGWKTIYDENYDEIISYGELANLLTAIKYALNISEEDDTSFDNINVDTIKVKNLVENRKAILHSSIISLTIKDQIKAQSSEDTSKILRLPAGYENSLSANFILWENSYTDTTYNSTLKEFNFNVTTVGEIDKVLAAIGELLADDNVSFSDISSFNYTKLFEEESQAKLISSKLISETIIQKISENAISIPNDPSLGLLTNTDRTAWWSEDGELKYFLTAVGEILSDSEKTNLNVDLNISDTYAKITNEATRTELLKSYLISETLTVNFAGLDLFSGKLPSYANSGINLTATNTDGSNNRDDWYIIDTSASSRSIEEKELWRLISAIHILLGDEFDTSTEFSIDQVLNNPTLIPSLTDAKVNTNDKVGEMLESKIIEETFVGVVKSLITGDGVLAPYLNVPGDAHYYAYTTLEEQEYDTRTIIESVYQMQKSGLEYRLVSSIANSDLAGAATAANKLATLNTSELADAFVISRTFNISIETFFNGMLETVYGYAYLAGLYGGDPLDPWNDVKLVQSDYNGLSKPATSALLKTNLDTIFDNLRKVY